MSAHCIWYFAFESNLSTAKFTGSRGIVPLKKARLRIPGWALVLDVAGLPYAEPAFASIERIDSTSALKGLEVQGGGSAYKEVELEGEALDDEDALKFHGAVPRVKTLITVCPRHPTPLPSQRYWDIVLDGARESKLSREYCAYLNAVSTYQPPPPRNIRRYIGAKLFLAFWSPIMAILEWITNFTANVDGKGHTPGVVQNMVRLVVLMIWFFHDYIHSPIWGRGDGLNDAKHLLDSCTPTISEKSALFN